MNNQTYRFLTMGLAASFAGISYASMANTPTAAWDQTVAANALDQSVRIGTTTGSGSGGMFDRQIINKNGTDYLMLCFATADHVVAGGTLSDITFDTNFSLNAAGATFQSVLGKGFDGNQDLAFIGLMYDWNSLSGAFQTYINGFAPLSMAAFDTTGTAVRSYGYGRTARYWTPGGGPRAGFIWDSTLGLSGIHRYVNHTVLRTGNYAGGPYAYSEIGWDTSAAAGEGQINSGDSGGVILQNGTWVGVNTYAVGTTFRIAGVDYETFAYGDDGGGLAFTQQDVDWLYDNCETFSAVPEPATMTLLGLAALARRRRTKKAQF